MNNIAKLLPDNAFWRYFLAVLSIPHPSGHEEQLRDYLAKEALKHGLIVRTDEAGNLAIDRPAAPGFADAPRIILQGHMDMVPQTAPGVKFDFERDPVTPVLEDGWVSTGGRTTLGADDGVALAAAMEVITDPDLRCGRLRALFTVSEEVGLWGAAHIDPEFLDADILLSLDGSESLIIGCAGGARIEGSAKLPTETPAADAVGVTVQFAGFHGGHSGEDIDRAYGSANVAMRELLTRFPNLRAAKLSGGTLDNALSREASVTGAIPAAEMATLEAYAANAAKALNAALEAAADTQITVTVTPAVLPPAVLTGEAAAKLSKLLNELPHGVLEVTEAGDIAASCNLSIFAGEAGGEWRVTLLARSLYNDKRDAVAHNIEDAFGRAGFAHCVPSTYSSWSPQYNSPLLALGKELFKALNKVEPQIEVCRGGLETGLFSGLNPELEMLATGPEHLDMHSPAERLNVASVERFRPYLRALIERASELKKQ